jgi:hypothetical protein
VNLQAVTKIRSQASQRLILSEADALTTDSLSKADFLADFLNNQAIIDTLLGTRSGPGTESGR